MLKITEPLKLKTSSDILSHEDVMGRRIMSGYNLFGAEMNAEELYFLLAGTPEEQAARQNVVNNGFINNSSINTSLTVELVNNFINRLSQTDGDSFTYNDSVFITDFLTKAGITDVNEFVSQIKQIQSNAESITAIAQTSEEIKNTLNSAINETNVKIETGIKSSESRQKAENTRLLTLHDRIYSRLMTRELTAIVHNHSVNPTQSIHSVTNAEIKTAEQLFTMQKQTVSELERDISEVSRIFTESAAEQPPQTAEEPRRKHRRKAKKTEEKPKQTPPAVLPIVNYIEKVAKKADLFQTIKNNSQTELNSIKSYVGGDIANVRNESDTSTHNTELVYKSETNNAYSTENNDTIVKQSFTNENKSFTENSANYTDNTTSGGRTDLTLQSTINTAVTDILNKSYNDGRSYSESKSVTSAPHAQAAQNALFSAVSNAIYTRLIRNENDNTRYSELNYAVSSSVDNIYGDSYKGFTAENSVEYYLNNSETAIAQAVITQLSENISAGAVVTADNRSTNVSVTNPHTTVRGGDVTNVTQTSGAEKTEMYFNSTSQTENYSPRTDIRSMLESSVTQLEQRLYGADNRRTSITSSNVRNEFSSAETTLLNNLRNVTDITESPQYSRTDVTNKSTSENLGDSRTSVSQTNVTVEHNAPHSEFTRSEQTHISVTENNAQTVKELIENDIKTVLNRAQSSYTENNADSTLSQTNVTHEHNAPHSEFTHSEQTHLNVSENNAQTVEQLVRNDIQNMLNRAQNSYTENNTSSSFSQSNADNRTSYTQNSENSISQAEIEYRSGDSVTNEAEQINNTLNSITQKNIEAAKVQEKINAEIRAAMPKGLDYKRTRADTLRFMTQPKEKAAEMLRSEVSGYKPADITNIIAENGDNVTKTVVNVLNELEKNPQKAMESGIIRRGEPSELAREIKEMEKLVTKADVKQPQKAPTERELKERAELVTRYEESVEKTERRIREKSIYREMPSVPIVYKREAQTEEISQTSEKLTRDEQKITEIEQNETRREKIEQNIVNNRDITQNVNDSERIAGMVQNAVQGSINQITDKVYSNIERRLKSERSRRGF